MNRYTLHIDEADTEINLDIGKYRVDIVGGWGVRLNDFNIELYNKADNVAIPITETTFRIQSIKNGRRALRVYSFEVQEKGQYLITCIHPKSLEVKRSKLNVLNVFRNHIPIDQIQIQVY